MICRNCKKEIGGAAVCPYCHTQQKKKRAPFALRPGTVLAGRYAISKVADTDNTCITYDAWDKRAKKMLTVKEYFPAGVVKRQKFNREPAACVSYFRLSDAERKANALRPGTGVLCSANGENSFASGKLRFVLHAKERFPDGFEVIDTFEENDTAYLAARPADASKTDTDAADKTPVKKGVGDGLPDTFQQIWTEDTREEQPEPEKKQIYHPEPVPQPKPQQSRTKPKTYSNTQTKSQTKPQAKKNSNRNTIVSLLIVGALIFGVWYCFFRDKTKTPLTLDPVSSYSFTDIDAYAGGRPGYTQYNAYQNLIARSAFHTVGLKSNGTVVAEGDSTYGQCNVDSWRSIVQVEATWDNTYGLRSDGTVVVKGTDSYGQSDVRGWTDIIEIAAGSYCTYGLRSNGTVVMAGKSEMHDYGQYNVGGWTDIVAISASSARVVGLKSDGTVVAAGKEYYNENELDDWTDIVAIAAGEYHTVGLKSDGTVVAKGKTELGQCDVGGWTDIVAVAAGGNHTVGLKSDGTVVAAGNNRYDQCSVSDWKNIVAVAAASGGDETIGMKSDGTVIGIGRFRTR